MGLLYDYHELLTIDFVKVTRGYVWLERPSLSDSFIPYTLPVLIVAFSRQKICPPPYYVIYLLYASISRSSRSAAFIADADSKLLFNVTKALSI
jgi:hypothetical protein